MKRRITSLIVFVLVLSLMPITVFARDLSHLNPEEGGLSNAISNDTRIMESTQTENEKRLEYLSDGRAIFVSGSVIYYIPEWNKEVTLDTENEESSPIEDEIENIELSRMGIQSTHTHTDNCYNGDKHTHVSSCYKANVYDCSGCQKRICGGGSGPGGCVKLDNVKCSGCVEPGSSACPGHTMWGCPGHELYCPHGGQHSVGSTLVCTKNTSKYFDSEGVEVSAICNTVVMSITPLKATETINKGGSINLKATATFLNGTTGEVTCTSNFDTGVIGTKQATLIYNGRVGTAKTIGTRTCTKTVTVEAGLTGLVASPIGGTTVLYGTPVNFTVTAKYDGKSDKTVTGHANTTVVATTISDTAIQKVISYTYSYTEDGTTVSAEPIRITYQNYPTDLIVILENTSIYQSQQPVVKSKLVTWAYGANTTNNNIVLDTFDNLTVENNVPIVYKFSLNDKTASRVININILEDLKGVLVNKNNFEIYRGKDLDLVVTGQYNTRVNTVLNNSEYTIKDDKGVNFNKDIYNRDEVEYIVSHSYKNVTKTTPISIKVLPNIEELTLTLDPQTLEGVHVPFNLTVKYEDNSTRKLSELDLEAEGLTILSYDLTKIGEQTITFRYEEGGKTLEIEGTTRVRALINVSIPKDILVNLNSNTGEVEASMISIVSLTREEILVNIEHIEPDSSNNTKDVQRGYFQSWNNLGKEDSKNIAIGLDYDSGAWVNKTLTEPLYVVDANKSTELGVIGASNGSSAVESKIKIVGNFGTSVNTQGQFRYKIKWSVKLSEG